MVDDMTNDNSLVTSITLNVSAGHSSLPYADYVNLSALPASNRFKNVLDEDRTVIPGHAKHEPQMCYCTSGNLEIPGLVLRTIPE